MTANPTHADALFKGDLAAVQRRAGTIFFWLLGAQWVLGIALALWISPRTWVGAEASTHLHVYLAVFLGGAISGLPMLLLKMHPNWVLTRHVTVVAQMLWSALLIHITGGRIETHFHVFGSLAFVAVYRDPWLFLTGTVVVAADHLIRGLLWPESVYGIANPAWWRFLEHAAWVVFENIVLVTACLVSLKEMRVSAEREAQLAAVNATIEQKVIERTAELAAANEHLATEMRTRLQREIELRQAQKLESVGRLAAGVAHEINSPVQYASDSVHFARASVPDIFRVVEKLAAVHRSALEGSPTRALMDDAGDAMREADVDFLAHDVPSALDLALTGLARVATIARSMSDYARPDQNDMAMADLNRAIESTALITKHEYKNVADLELELGELPRVICFLSDLNQALLNLILNAAYAIGEKVGPDGGRGRITLRTSRVDDDVLIEVEDTGLGIPEEIEHRVFDPFFTTKPVGEGTGQGLAIARSVVVDKHGGSLWFESRPGKGTTFFIRIPIDGSARVAARHPERAFTEDPSAGGAQDNALEDDDAIETPRQAG
ncbi:MAG TPA: ATP-binding protein [Myxococcota bacterium]|nr:ATP-binding protein [Myxococcota bacterium]